MCERFSHKKGRWLTNKTRKRQTKSVLPNLGKECFWLASQYQSCGECRPEGRKTPHFPYVSLLTVLMKLKAKIKTLLLARSGLIIHEDASYSPSTTTTFTTTVTTTTSTAVTATTSITTTSTCVAPITTVASPVPLNTPATTMPRDYPSASKSMMNLSLASEAEEQPKGLQKYRSVWDVASMDGIRRKILRSRSPNDPGRSKDKRQKRHSYAQPPKDAKKDADDRYRSVSSTIPACRQSLSSGSSSVSSTLTPDPPSSAAGPTEIETDVFTSDGGMKEAQSMMALSRPNGSSNSSEEDAKVTRKRSVVS